MGHYYQDCHFRLSQNDIFVSIKHKRKTTYMPISLFLFDFFENRKTGMATAK